MYKNIFKKTFLFTLFIVACFMPFSLKGEEQPYFELIIHEDFSRELYGVQHRKIKGQINLNGVLTNQQINYTAANLKEQEDIFVVASDNFSRNGYGASNLRAQAFNINQRFENQAKVVSGVNGDGFDIRGTNVYGMPSGPHISNYRTLNEGYHYRTLIGIHDDGSVTIGPPEYKGYEVIVLDDAGAKKMHQVKIDGFNRLPDEGEVTAFFVNHDGPIISPDKKMVFKGIDVKAVDMHNKTSRYFAEGKFSHITNDEVLVEVGDFVLMGDAVFAEDLINKTDTVYVENVLGGIHEGIREGICGGQILLEAGEIIEGRDEDVHPRTAVGVKEDGTLFFVTVDGRQPDIFMDGVDYEQLAHLMKYFGAVDAVNLDGGGSTTMLFYDEENDYYETQNSPSDNPLSLRPIGNGFFFMCGNIELPLPPIPYPETREILEVPQNIYFDENQILRFSPVDNATYYELTIDGKRKYKTESNSFQFELDYGQYDLEVKAFGDHELYKQSPTKSLKLGVYSEGMIDLIEGLKEYGRKANKKIIR